MQLKILVFLPDQKIKKCFILMSVNELLRRRQVIINAFKCAIFPTHSRALPSNSDDDFDRTLTSEPQSMSSPIKPTH